MCEMVQYLISPTQYTHCSCCSSAFFQNGRRTLSYDLGLDTIKWEMGNGTRWWDELMWRLHVLYDEKGEKKTFEASGRVSSSGYMWIGERNHHRIVSDNAYILCMDFFPTPHTAQFGFASTHKKNFAMHSIFEWICLGLSLSNPLFFFLLPQLLRAHVCMGLWAYFTFFLFFQPRFGCT